LFRKQTALAVEHALLSLPERQRAAITLVHYEGLTSAEACGVLEIGVEALESLLARGRRALREQLRALAQRTEHSDGEQP
jgi:RNA polymerase sigma-70 factor (ECF subfamily)